ncbi:FAD-binding oxidoreductase [Polymorphobacter sp.]|uniref:FAD-binding oxidoreductase n=1 Tax=Polymorphobacter sp. TaxID=1909290 RepID=UPI003F6EEE2D
MESMMPSATALAALADAAGPGNATSDPNVLSPHLADWRGKHFGQTPLLLLPRTTEQVAAIVKAAAQYGVALIPQGGNTGLVGGGIPPADGHVVMISLKRMNRIYPVDSGGMTLRAEAGAILSDVHDAAAGQGLNFPLSLAARGSATIGGLAATNAGGVQVLRHGTMRALVAGLRAVLPDGEILDQLAGLPKDNRGYDLKQLLIGSEGTLGIITELTLKLVPEPEARIVAWAGLPGPEAALNLLRRLRAASGGQVESFELMPDDGLQLVLAHAVGARPPLEGRHPWHVLIELAGPAALEAVMVEALGAAMEAGEIGDATIAGSAAQAAALWQLRENLPEAERRDGPALHHDISVPVAALPDFAVAAAARVETAFPGSRVMAFGHLGDGNLHFNVRVPAGPDGVRWAGEHGPAVTRMVHDLVTEAGGSISAEHGIGTLKRADLARLLPPARLAMMRAIKHAIDPQGLMNPGKIL